MGSDTVLALDLGTHCGWAVLRGGKLVDSGCMKLNPKKGRARGERWRAFRAKLHTLVVAHHPSVIVFERVRRHLGTTAAHVYGGFLATLELVEAELIAATHTAFRVLGIEVTAWKKATVGKGNASKDAVRAYVRKTFHKTTKTHDESDAIAIGAAFLRLN